MIKTSVAEAKAKLSEYLERAEHGERIVICRHNKPVAQLGPVEHIRTEPRPVGRIAGRPRFSVNQGFFLPLSEAELDAWDRAAIGPVAKSSARGEGRASRVAETSAAYEVGSKSPTRRRRSRS